MKRTMIVMLAVIMMVVAVVPVAADSPFPDIPPMPDMPAMPAMPGVGDLPAPMQTRASAVQKQAGNQVQEWRGNGEYTEPTSEGLTAQFSSWVSRAGAQPTPRPRWKRTASCWLDGHGVRQCAAMPYRR